MITEIMLRHIGISEVFDTVAVCNIILRIFEPPTGNTLGLTASRFRLIRANVSISDKPKSDKSQEGATNNVHSPYGALC